MAYNTGLVERFGVKYEEGADSVDSPGCGNAGLSKDRSYHGS